MHFLLGGFFFKKDKHGWNCHKQQKLFSPLVLSVYGMIFNEAQVLLTDLIQLMAAKMEEPILNVKGWVNRWIEI